MSALTEDDRLRLEERLCNWADWVSADNDGPAMCASAEHRYRAKSDSETLQSTARFRAIDADDAEKVERAVRSLHRAQAAYIQLKYVRLCSKKALQKKMGYKPNQQDELHAKVLLSLKAELLKIEKARPFLIRSGAMHWAGIAR